MTINKCYSTNKRVPGVDRNTSPKKEHVDTCPFRLCPQLSTTLSYLFPWVTTTNIGCGHAQLLIHADFSFSLNIKIIFFIFKKLFLILIHQNILKNQNIFSFKKINYFLKIFKTQINKYKSLNLFIIKKNFKSKVKS